MTHKCRSVTGTVLFGEKIPYIKPKRHLRAAVIISAEVIAPWLH